MTSGSVQIHEGNDDDHAAGVDPLDDVLVPHRRRGAGADLVTAPTGALGAAGAAVYDEDWRAKALDEADRAVAVQEAYQRGYEDGRRAEQAPGAVGAAFYTAVRFGNCEGVRGDGVSCTSGTIPGRRARWMDARGRLMCGTCRRSIEQPGAAGAAVSVVHLTVDTRHPEDYELINHADGTHWRATRDGRWVRAETAEAE